MSGVPSREEYLLGSEAAERTRLKEQGALLRSSTVTLLERAGVAPGLRVLDVGCGPLGALALLAELVGPDGEVTGLERDPAMLAEARDVCVGLDTISLVAGDATALPFPDASFHVTHERLVLANVPDPAAVVAEMARVTRPGGVVALQDTDAGTWACEPPHPAWDALYRAVTDARRRMGLDNSCGRHLPALLRDEGLELLGMDACLPLVPGASLQGQLLPAAVGSHRVAMAEPDDPAIEIQVAALVEHLRRADTFVMNLGIFQAWARRPAARR